ncbi:MAG TPA: efflux RND transporter permease subunit [Plasticicumulans sp.]|nr:efflux RND transporter permease subunit [Plasticicumulans sp.]
MRISDFSIEQPMVTVVAMLALVLFGLFALLALHTDEFPDIEQPVIVVGIPYPGASPEGVEREILERVEESITGIAGIHELRSSASDGYAQLIVFFEFGKNMLEAGQEIRDRISAVRDRLPDEMKEPVLTRVDPADIPVVSLTLASDRLTPVELTRLADPGIVRELRQVPGVAQVDVAGGQTRELNVQLDPAALAEAGVTLAELVQALNAQNLAAPVGRLTHGAGEQTLRLRGRLDGPEAFAQLVVARRGERVIRLGQLAHVSDGAEEARSLAFYDGRPAIGIGVLKSRGASTTAVSAALRAQVAQVQATLPAGVDLRIVQDAGERVGHSVANVGEHLVLGALLTVLTVFLFLNSWRSTVITGLALPVSVLAAFVAVWACGFTLNQMSLLGLSLAIGILIDDAIVVRENIVRHVHLGRSHLDAARAGTAEIGLAVTATTFSIVAVFVPVAFMSGVAGQWFKPFALTIACAVLVSLFVSFSLDPMLSAYWPDPQPEAQRRGWLTRALDRFNAGFDRLTGRYVRVIGWALDHRLVMTALALGSFFGALWLQAQFGGAAFVPPSDRSELRIVIDTPPGSSLEHTRVLAERVAGLARALPEVRYTYTRAGSAGDFTVGGVDTATVYVRLKPKSGRSRTQEQIGNALRAQAQQLAGAEVAVFSGGFGGAYKPIQLRLIGPDARELAETAQRLLAAAREVPGIVDANLSTRGRKPEYELTVDRGLAGALGITVADIGQGLRVAYAGLEAGDWIDPDGETRDVTVRLAPEYRELAAGLARLPVAAHAADGRTVSLPLGQIVTVTPGLGPRRIDHFDTERVIVIEAATQGVPLAEAVRRLDARLAREPLPPGLRLQHGGEAKDQAEVFGNIFSALGIALLLMYLILVLQFGSFLDPVPIMASLPLSLIGVVLALLVTGDTLNIMSLIGVMLLMGVVAKNAILLIDFARQGRARGLALREALIEAGRVRLRPILMTTFALTAGMIPVALGHGEGADFRAPLGRAVIGGTLTATLLTLLVIPTFYELTDEWRTRVQGWCRRR